MTENTYSRLDLAKEQLGMALTLFLDHLSYASVITLAGAAEEIFGKELSRQGKEPILEWKFNHMKVFHELLHGKELQRKSFFAEENNIRNSLKHFGENESPTLTADLENAACWMLVRSIENARRLDIEIERFSEFDNWLYEHVVGI